MTYVDRPCVPGDEPDTDVELLAIGGAEAACPGASSG
jgi:hypothetical protein